MEKKIFKKGDRVFDISYGWGKVKEVSEFTFNGKTECKVLVCFKQDFNKDISIYYEADGSFKIGSNLQILSFTEYDLVNGGFSQERIIDYSEYIGKYCKFWNKDKYNTVIDRFVGYDDSRTKFFESTFDYYENFEPLTEEQIEILNLK